MTPEPEKLREAIQHTKDYIRAVERENNGASFHNVVADRLKTLVAAVESTLPRTAMVCVWRVEYAQAIGSGKPQPYSASFVGPSEAQRYLETIQRWPRVSCARIVQGQQEVSCE